MVEELKRKGKSILFRPDFFAFIFCLKLDEIKMEEERERKRHSADVFSIPFDRDQNETQ